MELKNIKFLKLFDNLYRKNPGRIDIDFVPFFSTYFTKYKKFFDREIQNYNQEEKKSKKKFNLSNRIGDRKIFNYSYVDCVHRFVRSTLCKSICRRII